MSESVDKKSIVRWGDWISAILVIILIQIAAARLVATLWTKSLYIVQIIALLGTLLGLLLGKSIFRRFWVVFFAVAYGLAIIPWQLGLLQDSDLTWTHRLANMWGRLVVITKEVFTRSPVTDSLLFLTLMAVLFWFLAVYTGFIVIRDGNPWKVIIPGGIAIFVIHSFDPLLVSRSWYLAFYLFFALIIVARQVYLQNSVKWKETRTHTPPDMGFDFSRITLILSMVIVFFAWNVPILSETFKPAAEIWQTASRPWLSAKDRFSFMFSSLRASVGLVQNFYGDLLPLGLGTPLSDQVVMEVQAPSDLPNSFRFYWEARTYSTYLANHWTADSKTTQNLTSTSVDINQPGKDIRPLVTTTFFPHEAISNLFTAPEPLWLNIPTKANMVTNSDGSVDYQSILSKDFVRPGEQYTVKSAVDAVTKDDLVGAGNDYPQWVLDEYLQLPGNITLRTRQLATSIAAGKSNTYDIATVVTDWLRNNIVYDQVIDEPPANQDRIDWFLFDYKRGFCNYYASAEVVLLRSLGIPARMAVGFAQGERQTQPIVGRVPEAGRPANPQDQIIETATYVVRQRDAHAWPEVYFPNIGWVIFEPTVSQPVLFRPTDQTFANQNQNTADPNQADSANLPNQDSSTQDPNLANLNRGQRANFWTLPNILRLIFLFLAIGVLVFVLLQVRRGFKVRPFLERASIVIPEKLEINLRRLGVRPPAFLVNWVYYQKLPSLSRSYMEINHALRRLGGEPAVQDTPAERTASLVKAIPASSPHAERLLTEYQTSIYTPNKADPEAAHIAGVEIRKLSWQAKLKQILARFQEPERDRKKESPFTH